MPNRTRLLAAVMLLFVAAAVLGPFVATARAAPPKVFVQQGYYENINNPSTFVGEFDISPVAGQDFVSPVVTSVTPFHAAASFATFCIQPTENVTLNASYWVQLSTSLNHGLNIPLAPKAAYLFSLWNSGSLPGYDYSAQAQTGGERGADAEEFEELLYKLQGFPFQPFQNTLQQQAWLAIANGYVGSSIGNVRVMRLYKNWSVATGFSGPQQDLLVELGPEPGTLGFLAFGLVGALPFLRRRKTA